MLKSLYYYYYTTNYKNMSIIKHIGCYIRCVFRLINRFCPLLLYQKQNRYAIKHIYKKVKMYDVEYLVYYILFLGLPQVILPSVHLPRIQGAPAFLKTLGAISLTISSILSASCLISHCARLQHL